MIGVVQKFELENFLLTDYPVIWNFAATLFAIFDCKHILWKNELDDEEKKSLGKYVNNKLEAVFGIKISSTSNNRINYNIKQLFII